MTLVIDVHGFYVRYVVARVRGWMGHAMSECALAAMCVWVCACVCNMLCVVNSIQYKYIWNIIVVARVQTQ